MMDKKRVEHIIQDTPYRDFVDFLLDRCNLSEKELALIYARAKEEISQEKYAEQIGYSPRYVQIHEDKAYQKIIKNWSQLEFLNYI